MRETLKLKRVVDDDVDAGNQVETAESRASRFGISITQGGNGRHAHSNYKNRKPKRQERFENEHSLAQAQGNVAAPVEMDNINVVSDEVNGNINVVDSSGFDFSESEDMQAALKANSLTVADQNPYFSGDEMQMEDTRKAKKRGMGFLGRNARKSRNRDNRSYSSARYE